MNQLSKHNVRRGAIYLALIGIAIGLIHAVLFSFITVGPLDTSLAILQVCVISVLLPSAFGWLVAQWGSAANFGKGVSDGAIAAGVGILAGGAGILIIETVTSIVFNLRGIAASGVLFTMIASFIGDVVVQPIIAALFGALGGFLYVAIRHNRG